jgi:hypothetical protein
MKDKELKKLFEAARGEKPLEPSATFADRVLAAIRSGAVPQEQPAWIESLVLPARQLLAPALALLVIALSWSVWMDQEKQDPGDLTSLTDQWIFEVN